MPARGGRPRAREGSAPLGSVGAQLRYCTFTLPDDLAGEPAPGRVEGDEVIRLAAPSLVDVLAADAPPADGERYPLAAVTLLAPIPRPPSIRDFFAFEQHIATAREEILAQATRNTRLYPGDVLGSGTVGTGSILEHDDGRWLTRGDVVELEIEGIGTLSNRII
jgi:Fumarylacetoacetate (FAA) hydrolase family/Domain of unknown function (DUF2437)